MFYSLDWFLKTSRNYNNRFLIPHIFGLMIEHLFVRVTNCLLTDFLFVVVCNKFNDKFQLQSQFYWVAFYVGEGSRVCLFLQINGTRSYRGLVSFIFQGMTNARTFSYTLEWFAPRTVNPLYNVIRYNSKIRYNVHSFCTKSVDRVYFSWQSHVVFRKTYVFVIC